MNPTLIIARLTFQEAARRKIVLTAVLLGVCFLILYNVGMTLINVAPGFNVPQASMMIARREGISFLFLAGLYTITFLSIGMAAIISADTLAGEINSGTVQTVATKPIPRSSVVFGKWLGFAGLLALYLLLMAGGVVVSVWIQTRYLAPHLLLGLGLMYMESLVMMSVALLLSSRLSALATGGAVFGLYGLSFIGGWVEQFGTIIHSSAAVNVGIVSSLIFPTEAMWRRAAFEMQSPLSGILGMSPFSVASVPSPLMVVYAGVFVLAALAFTLRIFSKRDL